MDEQITQEQQYLEPLIDIMRALQEHTQDMRVYLEQQKKEDALSEIILAQTALDNYERYLGFAAQELGYSF